MLTVGRLFYGRSCSSFFDWKLQLKKLTSKAEQIEIDRGKTAVLITGCDSGLGYAFTRHCMDSLGLVVIACCLNSESEGALQLGKDYKKGLHVVKLDLLSLESIADMKKLVSELIETNNYQLYGLVNNAGVMTMGQFEWFTHKQIMEMVIINLIGTMNVTKCFIPVLRKTKGRIVNVSSHCSLAAMPGLSVYGATKAALESWSSSLSMELEKFNIDVVTLIPGSYVTQSHILKGLSSSSQQMWDSMDNSERIVHEPKFRLFYDYMSSIPIPPGLELIRDDRLMDKFDQALLRSQPERRYVNAPWRYRFYFILFALAPTHKIREFFVKRFVNLPGF